MQWKHLNILCVCIALAGEAILIPLLRQEDTQD